MKASMKIKLMVTTLFMSASAHAAGTGIGSKISATFLGIADELTTAAVGVCVVAVIVVGYKMLLSKEQIGPVLWRILAGGAMIAFATQLAKLALSGGSSTGF
jgi:hypothetical protein